jgi:hypothetical protein
VNRELASTLALAAAAAAAIIAATTIVTSDARADDITIDKSPFASSVDKAQVKADLLRRSEVRLYGPDQDAHYNEIGPVRSNYTSAQARSDYIAARNQVQALDGEDSGSVYFGKMRPGGTEATRAMGGAPSR